MAEPHSTAQRRRVYLHCRPIFSGVNAQVRKKKKIKELVDGSKASLQPLLRDIGQENVIQILRSLLEARIFESEVRAKVEFPDLFRPSSLRDVQREASENDAARLTEEILDSIASRHSEGLDMDDAQDSEPDEHCELVNLINGENKVEIPAQAERATDTTPPMHGLPSLYPSYLPYQTQHVILTTAQQVLEESCFDFATTAMQSVLQEKKWECPMGVELTKWTKLFRKGKNKLTVQTVPIDFASKEAHEMLTAVTRLRHTAVHRLPTTARGISQLLDAAVKLAQTLQDDLRAARLDEIRRDVNNQITAMELNKNELENTASAELQEIQRKRLELERMETDLIQRMLVDDKNNKILIGRLLEDSVHRIFRGEKQDKGNEEKEQKGDELEDRGGPEKGDGNKPELEEDEEGYTSGYETSAEERTNHFD